MLVCYGLLRNVVLLRFEGAVVFRAGVETNVRLHRLEKQVHILKCSLDFKPTSHDSVYFSSLGILQLNALHVFT